MTDGGLEDLWVYRPPLEPWLEVLHLDRDLLALNKPSGLLSVPGRDEAHADSAYARVLAAHPLAQVVHRLDLDTSGVLVVALRRKAERNLRQQFAERGVCKRYVARVAGHVALDEGLIDLPLSRATDRPRSFVDPVAGRPSQTRYRVLSRDDDGTSRLALEPLTGRSHQLRVHLLALGHPILGDRFYADDAARAAAPRLCLHAEGLTLAHPFSGVPLILTAPTPF